MKTVSCLVLSLMMIAAATEGSAQTVQSPRLPAGSLLGGSVPTGSVSSQPLALSLSDAIDRGLRYNLAVLSGTQEQRLAAAERLKALYDLYPKVNGKLSSTQEQINLAAFGFGGFPGISQIVGPFALVDARARLTQSVIDLKLIHDLREASENERAASFGNQNTRELVVLTVADIYMEAIAGASRISAVEAQVSRAQSLYNRATDLKNAGLIAGIDVLRAQVELQTQQQRLLTFRNALARLKLDLVRVIGIPPGQEINLTDVMPSALTPAPALDAAIQMANENRADLKRADALMRAAEEALNSARAENLPTLNVDADYGVIGRTPGQSHGTYTLQGSINFPIFNGSHSKSDRDEAVARLEQRRIEAADLKGRVESEIRGAFLDLQSAQEQVRVAQSSLELAHQQLDQAQDRFEAGVTSNLEVVQAQEAVALGDENVISSLYALNIAKALLARATGTAEQSIKGFLGGKQ